MKNKETLAAHFLRRVFKRIGVDHLVKVTSHSHSTQLTTEGVPELWLAENPPAPSSFHKSTEDYLRDIWEQTNKWLQSAIGEERMAELEKFATTEREEKYQRFTQSFLTGCVITVVVCGIVTVVCKLVSLALVVAAL